MGQQARLLSTWPSRLLLVPPTIRGDMVMKATLTVQKVHATDEEAKQLQQRLEEDGTSGEAIITATSRRDQNRARATSLEATKTKLRQQMAAAERRLGASQFLHRVFGSGIGGGREIVTVPQGHVI